MLRKVINACGVIISDAIEQWASRQSREELLALIREQTERIKELEDELDRLGDTNASLHNELFEAYGEIERARGKDPDPYDPYAAPENKCMNCGKQAGPYWCPHCLAT